MKQTLLSLLLMMLPMVTSAEAVEIDGIYYNMNSKGNVAEVTINNYIGAIDIPSSVIYEGIEYSVNSIGSYVFRNCDKLISISIPNSVKSIGEQAFSGCSNLFSVEIGNNVTKIGVKAFYGCSSLISVIIPNSVTSIGDYAFSHCGNMISITIGNGVTYIEQNAFDMCNSLTSVHISNLVAWCNIQFYNGMDGSSFNNSNPLSYAHHLYLNGEEIRDLIIPDSVKYIKNLTFAGCNGLTSVTIPDGVISIGHNAFYGCNGLTSVNIPKSLTTIGKNAFRYCSSLSSIIIPNSVTSVSQYAFADCSSLTNLIIPNNMTSISDYTFQNCSELASINIPNSVTSIGKYAFDGCKSLSSITIPQSVTSIGDYAFAGCNGLTSIIFHCNVIKKWFSRLPSIKDVIIGDEVTSIDDAAFYECSSLTSISIGKGLSYIGYQAFDNCGVLDTIRISDLKTWCRVNFKNNPLKYANHLFLNNEEIKDLYIPDGVTTISDGAFASFSSLNSLHLSNSVIAIGSSAFWYCNGLKTVSLGNNLNSIGDYAFCGCSNLNSITLPESLKLIKKQAFADCIHLESITLPASLEVIYQEAFKNCNALIKISSQRQTPPFIYNDTFSDFTIPVRVPVGSVEAYKAHDVWKNFINIGDGQTYRLAYIVDGKEYKTIEVEYGEAITPEAIPTKEGYTFSGWSEIPETMPAKDITITGTFTVNTYKLTYQVDGTGYKTVEIEYGSDIIPEAVPTKEGYTFSGWSEIPESMPAKDVTVTGTFTVNKYTLTYQVDGIEYKTIEVEYGTTITPEALPTKEGYTFSGWSDIPATMPAKDMTITGTFTINKYTLIYQVDSVEYKTIEIEYGAAITPEAGPTKEGYTFNGWSEIPETMPAKDVTVTGTFTINKYTLTYQVDSVEYKTIEIEYGAAITPEAEPTKEGYAFSGWSEIPETMPAKDVTVTGAFTVNKYMLTYQVDGAEYKTAEVEYGAAINPESVPSREGYTFSGWSEIPETMPAKDLTITGTFTINTYTLIYLMDGVEYKTIEVEYGSAITPEASPSKDGYTFNGWSEIPETMPAKDVTVTGSFTVNKYTLTYQVDGEEVRIIEVEYGAAITPEAEPSKEGYTFSGWSEIPETMPANDVTVIGTFTINTYKLTYMIDNEVYKVVEYKYGAAITPEPQPEGDYVTFVWKDVPETMPANDVTVYADYQTGIDDVPMSRGIKYIYAPNGKRIEKLQKGLNIVVMNDGTVRKVVIK